jgi:Calcium binding
MEWFAVVEWFGRPEIETDEAREHRIVMEIVVDAYDEQERAIGWYYYLEGKLTFPFRARCAARRSISPLKVGDEVEVIGMAPVEECEHEMFVEMRWDEEGLAVPLSQLKVIAADDQTREAVEDWLYWSKKGYQF